VAWDRIQGLDFLTTIPPRELGLDDSQVFRGSPSGKEEVNDSSFFDCEMRSHALIAGIKSRSYFVFGIDT
jgi:hypothetical protein